MSRDNCYRWLLVLCFGLGFTACAHHAPTAQRPGAIETAEAQTALSPEEIMDRDRLRGEIFSIDSEISSRQSQLTQFKMLDEKMWQNQADVLKGEIANLSSRKAALEAKLLQKD